MATPSAPSTACRAAARVVAQGFDYERAAELAGSAAALAEQVLPPAEQVEVLLESADALLACGRLADARPVYQRAIERSADPVARARAALGLGGVWVDEHRGHAARQRILGLQREALAALPAGERGLRARLEARLAAEAVYDGADVGPVFAAMDTARSIGDPRVLAEALSLGHHALLWPEHCDARLPIAEELIDVASRAGDELRTLFGLLWRTVDFYLAGDGRAERALGELRERADAVGCRTILHVVAAIDVMRMIREGRLDEAEEAAGRCFHLGVEVGDADATGYLRRPPAHDQVVPGPPARAARDGQGDRRLLHAHRPGVRLSRDGGDDVGAGRRLRRRREPACRSSPLAVSPPFLARARG